MVSSMPSSKSSSSKYQGSDRSHPNSSKHPLRDKNSGHRHEHREEKQAGSRRDQELEAMRMTHHASEESGGLENWSGEELYRLDEGSQIWRTADGCVIYWEVHRLTYQQLSEAIWDWAEHGLQQTQKLYLANITRTPHGGHRPALLDFFCPHRNKLVHDHASFPSALPSICNVYCCNWMKLTSLDGQNFLFSFIEQIQRIYSEYSLQELQF